MKKEKITTGTIVIFILFIGAFWALNYFAYGVPGVVFSCDNDNFIGFRSTNMPPAMIACLFNCNANISIKTEVNNTICINYAKGCATNNVLVPCQELENHIGENLHMEYSIQNGETKTEEIQYNK